MGIYRRYPHRFHYPRRRNAGTYRGVQQESVYSAQAALATSLSITNVTVGARSNRLLIVDVALLPTTGQSVSQVTFGGVSLTQGPVADNGTASRVERWYLIAPASSTATVIISITPSGLGDRTSIAAGVYSLYNVDQTTPLGNDFESIGNSTNPSGTISSSAVGELLIDAVASAAATLTADASQTQQWNQGVSGLAGAGSTKRAVAGQNTMQWTSSISVSWAMIANGVRYVGEPAELVMSYVAWIDE